MATQQMAEAVIAHLFQADARVNKLLGISLVSVSPGQAACRIKVEADYVNSHSICHGGILFALADAAMVYASCSTNRTGVTLGASIAFVRPARLGDIVTATAQIESDGRRANACTVRVTSQTGELIAVFQGTFMRFDTPVLKDFVA